MMNTKAFTHYVLATALLLTLSFSLPQATLAEEKEEKNNQDTIYTSVEERRLHTLMQKEREDLQKNKKLLDLREKELKTLEAAVDKKLGELDSKLEELKTMQGKIEELLAKKRVEEVKKVQNLGKIYEKMAPAKAASALAGMDQKLATELLAAMKPKAAAKVLNMLDRKKAAQLSTTFSTIQVE